MLGSAFGAACSRPNAAHAGDAPTDDQLKPRADLTYPDDAGPQQAVFAGGCFWCTEWVFQNLKGVTDVESGYAGGTKETANYQAVCTGNTDHAEAIRINYDPKQVTFGELLQVFFTIAHDPTQLNRQGPDYGRQYRSAVFYADDEQKRVTQAYLDQLVELKAFDRKIATTLEPLTEFFPAELYHQDYVANNPNQPYVRAQALPKGEKLREKMPERVQE